MFSNLRLTCNGRSIDVKVKEFSTNIQNLMQSLQVESSLRHFPIRAQQANLSVTVVARDYPELHRIRDFIRAHQRQARNPGVPLVSLWWPEREIRGWTAAILSCNDGEERFRVAPTMNIEFLLVDSLVSSRTWGSSTASEFDRIYEGEIPSSVFTVPDGSGGKKIPEGNPVVDGKVVYGPVHPDTGTVGRS